MSDYKETSYQWILKDAKMVRDKINAFLNRLFSEALCSFVRSFFKGYMLIEPGSSSCCITNPRREDLIKEKKRFIFSNSIT